MWHPLHRVLIIIYRGDFTHLHKMAVEVSGRSEYVHTSDFSPEEKEKIRQVRKPYSHIIYWDRKLFLRYEYLLCALATYV